MDERQLLLLQSAITAHAAEGISVVNSADGTIIYTNHFFNTMFGYAESELIGKSVEILTARTAVSPTEGTEAIVSALKSAGSWHGEALSIRKNGTTFWSSANCSSYLHPEIGTLLISHHSDISERKQAEAALRENNEVLQEGERIAQVGSWTLDFANDTLSWSDEIYRIFEIDPSAFSATYAGFLNAVHPEDRDAVDSAYTKSLETRLPYDITHRLLMSDGRVKWVRERCTSTFDASGKPTLSRGMVQDITDRKLDEFKLVELSNFLHLLMDAVPAVISYINTDQRYLKVNRTYERWFNCSAQEIEGQSMQDVLGDAAWKRVAPHFQRALNGEAQEFEAEMAYKKGGTRWVHASYLPVFDNGGSVRGIVAMVVDITARRRIESDLRRTRQQFAELLSRQDSIRDNERRHIAREIHDELGQLLTGMRLLLSAMQIRADSNKKTDFIRTTKQLEKLLDEATCVVQRVASNLHATVVQNGLLPALEGLAAYFRDLTGVSCELTTSGDIVDDDESRAATVFRIAQESLTNIARHAEANIVSMHLSAEPNFLRLVVHDDGRGIDFDSVKKVTGGLGLFGMQERAAIAGGRLTITSSQSDGTMLELELPLRPEKTNG